MERFKTLVADALKSVTQRQRLVTANLTGNAFLLFIVYSWIALNDLTWGNVAEAIPIGLGVAFFGTWLMATTLAAFHSGSGEVPFIPVLKRTHYFLPWAAALAGTVFLFQWMSSVLGVFVWVVGVAVIIALMPFASHAAGASFDRKRAADIAYNEQYWLISASLVVVGLYLPVLVFSFMPRSESLLIQMLAGGFRLGAAFFLAIGAWVTLAAVIGRLGAEERADARGEERAEDQVNVMDRLRREPSEELSLARREASSARRDFMNGSNRDPESAFQQKRASHREE